MCMERAAARAASVVASEVAKVARAAEGLPAAKVVALMTAAAAAAWAAEAAGVGEEARLALRVVEGRVGPRRQGSPTSRRSTRCNTASRVQLKASP
jgi:hypothetical protein